MRRPTLLVAACLALVSVADPAPARAGAGEVPDKYVGSWAGQSGEGRSYTVASVGTAAVVTDFGHTIDRFAFEVGKDGKVTGSGAATYHFNVTADAQLIATRAAVSSHLEGNKQQVEFAIDGTMSPDGILQLRSTARTTLTLVNAGERTAMEAWNVFGGVEGGVEIRGHAYGYDAFNVVVINGKTTKVRWTARKGTDLPAAPETPLPAARPDEALPAAYVGRWAGGMGWGISLTRGRAGNALTTRDLGFVVDHFEIDVAKDGAVTGSGAATFWFDISADAELVLMRKVAEAHLEGGTQRVGFSVRGTMSPKGELALAAEPERGLTVVNAGSPAPMDAWNVFGGVAGHVSMGARGWTARGADVRDPHGLAMEVAWSVRKKLRPLRITALVLNDIDDVKLACLSASSHTYFGGNTYVHGTITVEGPVPEGLASVRLEVLQNGGVVALGHLAPTPQSELLGAPFGDDEKIEIQTSELLFELPSDELAKIDSRQNGSVLLRVRARSTGGDEDTREFGSVEVLVQLTGTNRYGGRDEDKGGDDWLKPSVKPVVEHFASMTWGDCSNMNGGRFPPHASHNTGNDVDGKFPGYEVLSAEEALSKLSQRDAAAARELTAAGEAEAARRLLAGTDVAEAQALKASGHSAAAQALLDGAAQRLVSAHDVAVARRLVDCLNDRQFGSRITNAFVSFLPGGEDPARPAFAAAIQRMPLTRGGMADSVISHEPRHDTHFHFRIKD